MSQKVDSLDLADHYYKLRKYKEAIKIYKSLDKTENAIDLWQKMGNTYYMLHEYKNAEDAYREIIDEEGVLANTYLRFGHILRNNEKYEEARIYYQKFIQTNPQNKKGYFFQRACDWALQHKNERNFAYEVNMLSIETGGESFGVALYEGGLVYSRPFDDNFADSTVYNDLAFVSKIKSNSFLKIEKFAQKTESNFHEGSPCFTLDNQVMYYSSNSYDKEQIRANKRKRKSVSSDNINVLKIFASYRDGDTWKKAKELNFNNNEYSCAHPSISQNNDTLYFVSNMKGGFGGYDIYYVVRNEKDEWGKPINMGPQINTEEDEMFPFITKTGKLYFASSGHLGFGGFDIFSATNNDQIWGNIQNLGKPINSSKDDFGIVFHSVTNEGYLSSNRFGDNGYDRIYAVELFEADTISVTAMNRISKFPMKDVVINFYINNKESLLNTFKTNEYGKKELVLDQKKTYTVEIIADGFAPQIFNLPPEKHQDIVAWFGEEENLEVISDSLIRLKNIYFDLDKWNIRFDAIPTLESVIQYLNENPEVKIELGAHTDSRSSKNYNYSLSNKRAKSCVNYLTLRGINKKRVAYKGYGESQLLNKCSDGVDCPEEMHQQNRRVEIKLIEK
jgi:outer membrane protein OmpA-like peptidoglycan-associated protein